MTLALTTPMLQTKPANDERRARTPAFKQLKTYLPMMIVLGIAVPVAVYLMVMQGLGWAAPMLGAGGTLSLVAPSSERVILYTSANSTRYFAGIGGNYDTLAAPWRTYFTERKQRFREVHTAADLDKLSEGLVVLPSAVALSAAEKAAVAAFRAKGGAVLTTWATGSRDENGGWAGWDFLGSLGARMVGEIPATQQVNNLVLNGESPLSHSQPAGQRMFLTKTSETLLRLRGEMVAGRFMNWARVTDAERRDEGAIVFSEMGLAASRSASFAFAESVWESHPLLLYPVIDNTLDWLLRKPVVVRAAWPGGKRAAQIIEMDTEDGFANATVFGDMMKAIDYRASFYVLTSVGVRYPDVLSRLANDFEIGYHADVHDGFKGQPAARQQQRLQTMRTELGSVIGSTTHITGFRAPLESYDATTEAMLQQAGIRHHVADPGRTEARLPVFAKMAGIDNNDALVILPRTQRDDINIAAEQANIEQTAAALIDDFDLGIDMGALGLLSVHSQNFLPDATLTRAMPAFIERLQRRRSQIWLTSGREVASWWRQRERVKVASDYKGKRLEFNVTITGQAPVSGASLIVMLPQKGRMPTVQSLKIGAAKPTVTKIDEFRAAVVFDTLKPGNYAYQAVFQ